MQKSHVKKLFLEWMEKNLSQDKQAQVEAHLEACKACRHYYRIMSKILEKPDFSGLEQLKPDPYFPTRLRAVSGDEKTISHSGKFYRGFRLSLVSLLLLIAVGLGIFVGNGLFQLTRQDKDSQLVNAYYEVIDQQTISDRWEYVFKTQGEE
jgi:predicted anti-sigma-YlaC factor YlaD